jgi:hypothetical protein
MNERLTKRDTDGQAMMDCQKCKADWTGKHGKPMVDCTALYCRNRLKDLLAAYEDTGMTPEEIDMDHEAAETLRQLCRGCDLDRLEKLAEADKDGRLVVLPFTSGRTLLCKENIDSPRLMKDVELAIRYCSSCGIVFHMGYNVFCDLVKHGRITAVSEEAEKALEALKDA